MCHISIISFQKSQENCIYDIGELRLPKAFLLTFQGILSR